MNTETQSDLMFYPTEDFLTTTSLLHWGTESYEISLTKEEIFFLRQDNRVLLDNSSLPSLGRTYLFEGASVKYDQDLDSLQAVRTANLTKKIKINDRNQTASTLIFKEDIAFLGSSEDGTAPSLQSIGQSAEDWFLGDKDWFLCLASLPQPLTYIENEKYRYCQEEQGNLLDKIITFGTDTGTIANHFQCTNIELISNESSCSIDILFATSPSFVGSQTDLIYNGLFLFSVDENSDTLVSFVCETPQPFILKGESKRVRQIKSPAIIDVKSSVYFSDGIVII